MARRVGMKIGVYDKEMDHKIMGALNRFASPWANQGTAAPGVYIGYDALVDDNGDGTAAGRKRARGLSVPDPAGFIYGTRKRGR